MAPLPDRQPPVREPRDGAGARADGRRSAGPRLRRPGVQQGLLAAACALVALTVASETGVVGRGAVPDLARAAVAGVALFAVFGFGLTRLLLPDGLRRYEPLWVLPIGACACALSLTVLGYLRVPFDLSLPLTLVAFAGLGVFAWRRTGRGPSIVSLRRCGWPGYVALLLACFALIPLFRAGFVTVIGEGQDAHMAVGTAMFLQEHGPTDHAPQEPVDEVWLVWRSKPPIYYALAAHAQVAGLEVFQTISTQSALLFAIALLGFFLVARELLRAPLWAACAAAAVAGLDRMVLHTIVHPYFNQTWGLMTLPFALILSWWAVTHRSRRGVALLVLLLAVGAFAYPLMLPIPGLALAVWLWPERRRLAPRAVARRLGLSRRSALWMVPLGLILILPLAGVVEKIHTGANVALNPAKSLETWGGDLRTYYEEAWFLGMPDGAELLVFLPVLLYGGWLALRAVPPLMARGFLAVLAFALFFGVMFRVREHGYYFHFKVLSFVGPLALVLAVAGLARVPHRRWLGVLGVAALVGLGLQATQDELNRTFDQLPKHVLELRTLTADVPQGDSIRLDVIPTDQNWVAFMLHERPLCSQRPLLGTSYPRVRASRRADFILAKRRAPAPADAAGGPVRVLQEFALYRARPDLPGRENCSQAMVQGVTQVDIG